MVVASAGGGLNLFGGNFWICTSFQSLPKFLLVLLLLILHLLLLLLLLPNVEMEMPVLLSLFKGMFFRRVEVVLFGAELWPTEE